CHNKRPSYDYFDFIIEEPFNHIFTEKVSHSRRNDQIVNAASDVHLLESLYQEYGL
ncbi:hypothetical protein EV205_1391, partial [Blautia coccoides]